MKRTLAYSILAPTLLAFLVTLMNPIAINAAQPKVSDECAFERESLETHTLLSFRIAIEDLYAVGCLGGEEDNWPVAAMVRKHEEFYTVVEERPSEITAESLARMDERLRILIRALEQEITDGMPVRKKALEPILEPLRMAVSAKVIEINNVEFGPLLKHYWVLEIEKGDFSRDGLQLKLYKDILNPGCTDVPSQGCTNAYEATKRALQYAKVAELTVYQTVGKAKVAAMTRYVTNLDTAWESYFHDTRSQFPWELVINSYYIRNTTARTVVRYFKRRQGIS